MALLPPNRNRTGSGYTNINRVLQANQGNKLGSTVATGVQNQVQGVKNNLQTSQNNFNQQAQQNRLDSDQNKQQRDNVIGRFGDNSQSNFTPDMSNFQASSGLQDQYNTAKAKYEADRTNLQNQLEQSKSGVAAAQAKLGQTPEYFHGKMGSVSNSNAYEAAQNAFTDAQEKQATYQKMLDEGQFDQRIQEAQNQMNAGIEAERQKYIEDQRRIAAAQNGPTNEELAAFDKFRSGQYTGPTQLDNYDDLMGQAANTEGIGDLARSSGGKQELLRRFVGGDNYSAGAKKMDNLLLSESPEINNIRKASHGLMSDVQRANSGAGAFAQELQNRAQGFSNDTMAQLNDKLNPLSSKIDQQLNTIKSQNDAQMADRNNIVKEIQNGGIDAALKRGLINQFQANALQRANTGLTGLSDGALAGKITQAGNATRGSTVALNTGKINDLLNQYLKFNDAQNVNRAGAATSTQESSMNALQRLMGKQGSDVEFGQVPADNDYKAGGANLDYNGINNLISQTGEKQLQQYLKTATDRANVRGWKNQGRYATDAQNALDLWKQQSKFYGYDPENQ